jgi:hypothetical protein
MHSDFLNYVFAAAFAAVALAVAAICGVGLVVWLAGGRTASRKDRSTQS